MERPATPQTRAPFRATIPPTDTKTKTEDAPDVQHLFPAFDGDRTDNGTVEKTNLANMAHKLRKLAESAKQTRTAERIASSKRTTQSAPAALHYPSLVKREGEIVKALCAHATGRAASRLFAWQAERDASEGKTDDAVRSLEFARDADESDAWVQFALRINATRSGEWKRAADRLDDEIDHTQGGIREHALLWRATLGLAGKQDFHQGHAAAETAAQNAKAGPLPSLLSALYHEKSGNQELHEAVLEAAITKARGSKALLQAKLAGVLEGADNRRALKLYESIADSHPDPVTIHAKAARVALRLSQPSNAKAHLASAGKLAKTEGEQHAYLRAAVVTGLACGNDDEPSLPHLEVARDTVNRATRARVLLDRGDATGATHAAGTFLNRGSAVDRVYATALLLEAAVAADDDKALVRAARKAVAYSDLTPWVQALAPHHNVLDWAQEGTASIGPEGLAAALFEGDDVLEGTARAERAHLQSPATLTEHLLAVDVAAELGEVTLPETMEAAREALHPAARLGLSLALAELRRRGGDDESALHLLRKTFKESKHDPLAGYQLAALLEGPDPVSCADTLLATLDHASGPWAASVAMHAGKMIAESGGNPTQAYRLALDEHPAYFPAIWELTRIGYESGDSDICANLHRHAARQTSSPLIAGLHLVQAAQLLGHSDPVVGSQCIEEAAILFPEDAAIAEMLLRLSSNTSGAARALALEALASVSESIWARSALFRAGLEWEHANHAQNAIALFAEVSAEGDSRIVRHALDRIDSRLGRPQGVAERLFDDAKQAQHPDARIAVLEKLAQTDAWLCEDETSAALSMQSILEVAAWHIPALRFLQRYYARHGRVTELSEVTHMLFVVSNAPSQGRLRDSLLLHAGRLLDHAQPPRSRWDAERRRNDEALDYLRNHCGDPFEEAAFSHVLACERITTATLDELSQTLRSASMAWPEHPLISETYGRVREAAGDFVGAARSYQQAADLARSKARRVALRSKAGQVWLEDVADPIRAQACFESVLDEQMRPEALRGLINALELSRSEDALLARLELEAGLPHDPADLAWVLDRLAERYRLIGNTQRELATLQRLCDVDLESADASIRWARTLAQNGRTLEAREPYEYAISLVKKEQRPDAKQRRIDALLEYATFLYRDAKNRVAARSILQEVRSLEPDNAQAFHLALEVGEDQRDPSIPAPPMSTREPLPECLESFLASGDVRDLRAFRTWLEARHEWEMLRACDAVLSATSGIAVRLPTKPSGIHAMRIPGSDDNLHQDPIVRFCQVISPLGEALLKRSHAVRNAERYAPDDLRRFAQERASASLGQLIGVRSHARRDTFCVPIEAAPPMLLISDAILKLYDTDAWEHALYWGAAILRARLPLLVQSDTAMTCAHLREAQDLLLDTNASTIPRRQRRAFEALMPRNDLAVAKALAQSVGTIDEARVGATRRRVVDVAHCSALLNTGSVLAAMDIATFDGRRGPQRDPSKWIEHAHAAPLLRFFLSRAWLDARNAPSPSQGSIPAV